MDYQHTAGDRTPFTYVIRFPRLNQAYYGVRYAKGCKPKDLGSTYFSSSKIVMRKLKQDPTAVFEVRKIFDDPKKACLHETKVLKRLDVRANPKFLNRHNNDGIYPNMNRKGMFGKRHSAETILKQKAAKIGEKNPAFGKPGTMLGRKHTEETLKKMREAKNGKTWNTGKHNTEESKQKCRDSQLGAKSHRFKGYYHTPHGIFESSRLAAAQNLNHKRIQEWCLTPDKVVTKHHLKCAFLNKQHLGKTFRELGFWFEPH